MNKCKNVNVSSINRLLKQFRDTGTMSRRQGSDRPRSARTDENIDQVNDMVLSQEDQSRTHSTVREMSRKTGILKSSVVRIIRKDLQLKCFKSDVRKNWLRRTALLLSYFPSLSRTLNSLQMKRCSLWLQQWKNCENQLRFHRVKDDKIKRVFNTTV